MKTIIFANGIMEKRPAGLGDLSSFDLLIAADGGLALCLQFGAVPHILVGDMDSVEKADLERMEAQGVEIVRRPVRKDETDLELALKAALERGAGQITVVGALGARWDMTFINVLMLGADYLDGIDVRIMDGNTEIRRMKGPEILELEGKPGDGLSIMPISGRAEGITLAGLEYALDYEDLPFGSTRGLSNVFAEYAARISLKGGRLLVIITKKMRCFPS